MSHLDIDIARNLKPKQAASEAPKPSRIEEIGPRLGLKELYDAYIPEDFGWGAERASC
jgi:hypothetical protein